MSVFRFIRERKMRRDGGFWVRKTHWGDLPFLPIHSWTWISPEENYTFSDFGAKANIEVHYYREFKTP